MQTARGLSQPRAAATQPGAAATQPGSGAPGVQLLMRMRAKIEQLGLSDGQKQKVKQLLEQAGEKLKQIAASTERGSQEMREKARDLFDKTRDSLKEILTPQQWEKLSSGVRDAFAPGEKPVTQPRMIEEKMTDEKMSDGKMSPKDDDKSKEKSSDKPDQSGEAPADAPQAGQDAPALTLQKVDGQQLQLSAFKGKVVVLTFSSYSSPTFRRRAAALEEIRRKNDNRANFLFVYTKESHPKGGWEVDRNKLEGVDIEQASDAAARAKQAKRMHDALRFNWPMLVDSMDDSAAKAYGAGECTTVIIDRDGKIYSRLEWSDPYTLKRQLDELLSKPAPSKTSPDAGV
jgi:peroxiredoxin